MGRKQVRAFLGFVALASGCAEATQLEGRVINHVDGSPVSGAFVISRWTHYGSDPVGSRTSCSHIEIVRSDNQGHFVTSVDSSEPDVVVYAPGFQEYKDDTNELLQVTPYLGTPSQRAQRLQWTGFLRACGSNDIAAALKPLYQALDDEYRSLGLPAYAVKGLEDMERIRREEQQKTNGTKK